MAKLVYRIFEVVKDENLRVGKILKKRNMIDFYDRFHNSFLVEYEKSFYETQLKLSSAPCINGFEMDHDSMELAVKEIDRCADDLKGRNLTILPIVTV